MRYTKKDVQRAMSDLKADYPHLDLHLDMFSPGDRLGTRYSVATGLRQDGKPWGHGGVSNVTNIAFGAYAACSMIHAMRAVLNLDRAVFVQQEERK